MKQILDKNEITQLCNVFSLRRSGHHAVISWLQQCHEKAGISNVHINEDEKSGHVPDPDDSQWHVLAAGDVIDRALDMQDSCKMLFINYEDLSYKERRDIVAYSDPYWVRNGVVTRDVIVLRDWYNLVASRIQKSANDRMQGNYPLFDIMSWESLAALWVEHAQLALNDSENGVVYINFNKWHKNHEYRAQVAASFGVPNMGTINAVPYYGGGSSFDGVNFNGRAHKMQLDSRWKQLDGSLYPHYLAAINTSYQNSIDMLNQKLFGFGHSEANQQ